MKTATPKSFPAMTPRQLRQFIDGCHRARDYDGQFEAACRELNNRLDERAESAGVPA